MNHLVELSEFGDERTETMASGLPAKTCSLEQGLFVRATPLWFALAWGSGHRQSSKLGNPGSHSLAEFLGRLVVNPP